MDIESLIQKSESKILEYKRDDSPLKSILKTIVAFANTAGGILVLGVTNHENKIIGIKDPLKSQDKIEDAVDDNIKPALLPEFEIVILYEILRCL